MTYRIMIEAVEKLPGLCQVCRQISFAGLEFFLEAHDKLLIAVDLQHFDV